MMRAPSAMRGPGRTSVSDSATGNTHTRCSRTARMPDQPGRCAMPSTLRWPTMIRSGLARTMNSGLSLGNGPSAAGTMFLAPSRVRVSPMNEPSPAAYGPWLTSKYTRAPRAPGGMDCAAAMTAASMARQTFCASGTSSNWPILSITRCASACVLGSSATTFRPSARRRSAAREDVAISTTSGRSATMASMFGSRPPPTWGSCFTWPGSWNNGPRPPAAHTGPVRTPSRPARAAGSRCAAGERSKFTTTPGRR